MADSLIAQALARALQEHDATLGIRAELEPDYPFIADLYAEVRREELAPVPWPDLAKREFLEGQCRLQHDHYLKHYADADLLIVVRGDMPVGRVYVHATKTEIRLMEIAFNENERGRGIGTAIIRRLQGEASDQGIGLTLHVEPNNPAQRLYLRLGFRLIEHRGVYDFLGWPAAAAADSSA
jgi:ribosomal protein S18 acetylase RimI-like enzyme